MKIRASIEAIAAGVILSVTFAAAPVMAANSQQSKMTDCNASAAGKKGDDRKAFMKDCLASAPVAASAPMTQQQKMTACNASATGKKGDDRKAFMKDCLSNKS
ncbi:PsiF family protein [Caballeronia sp.]|uniref:PsiF family protein n=1 Tax=Caballeronia sp. TaxID=1931223 RepID=UPI003C42633F